MCLCEVICECVSVSVSVSVGLCTWVCVCVCECVSVCVHLWECVSVCEGVGGIRLAWDGSTSPGQWEWHPSCEQLGTVLSSCSRSDRQTALGRLLTALWCSVQLGQPQTFILQILTFVVCTPDLTVLLQQSLICLRIIEDFVSVNLVLIVTFPIIIAMPFHLFFFRQTLCIKVL